MTYFYDKKLKGRINTATFQGRDIERRLEHMDRLGVDVHVLSIPAPAADRFNGAGAVRLARMNTLVQQMAATESFTYTWTPGSDCLFELIGPGSGTWEVTVTADGGTPATLNADSFDDLPRQTLYSDSTCATTYVVTWVAGTFGLDAVLG